MKKKPMNQTEKISHARWEFLTRNPGAKAARMEEAEHIREDHAWLQKHLQEDGEETETFEEFLKGTQCRPAARASTIIQGARMQICDEIGDPTSEEFVARWREGEECPVQQLFQELGRPLSTVREGFAARWRELITDKVNLLLGELLGDNPDSRLVISIDLTRSKEAIRDEVGDLVTAAKAQSKIVETRFKWLSNVEKLLKVWDLWEEAGKTPALQTFRNIARETGRPLSTVKSQWLQAYEMINGKKYDPDKKYTTPEKQEVAIALCASCAEDCYREVGGHMEFYPCPEYDRIWGKEKDPREQGYNDALDYGDDDEEE